MVKDLVGEQSRDCDSETFLLNDTLLDTKETKLERADFNLQLLMFVSAEKERRMFIIFFLSSFCQLLSPLFPARAG